MDSPVDEFILIPVALAAVVIFGAGRLVYEASTYSYDLVAGIEVKNKVIEEVLPPDTARRGPRDQALRWINFWIERRLPHRSNDR